MVNGAGSLGLGIRHCCFQSSPLRLGTSAEQQSVSELIVGNPKNGLASSTETQCTLNDIVGLNLVHEQGNQMRLPAGELLSLMDICAARAGLLHLRKSLPWKKGESVACATVAATDMKFKMALLNGDMANLTGTVVAVGNSSMTVEVEASRTAFPTRTRQSIAKAYFYMVALRPDLGPAPIVPGLRLAPKHVEAHHRALKVKERNAIFEAELLGASERVKLKTPAELETAINRAKPNRVRMEDTAIQANRFFFPAHLNLNKTIFGGEILRWMELQACHCGRMFTRNKRVYSIAMHDITFKRPIFTDDWVTLEAAVVFVQNTTMVVEVRLFVQGSRNPREGRHDATTASDRCEWVPIPPPVLTNEATFVLTNFDDVGMRQEIETGLDVAGSSPEWQLRYAAARWKYEHRKALPTD
jgi:acyl-CoA hydrolase